MTNACARCAIVANDAWDTVADFLRHPPESILRRDLERLKMYTRLAWRVEQSPDHDDSNVWMLQALLQGKGDDIYDEQAAKFEERYPVDYPQHLRTIQEVMERRCKVIEPDT